jgi:hypothetical protein
VGGLRPLAGLEFVDETRGRGGLAGPADEEPERGRRRQALEPQLGPGVAEGGEHPFTVAHLPQPRPVGRGVAEPTAEHTRREVAPGGCRCDVDGGQDRELEHLRPGEVELVELVEGADGGGRHGRARAEAELPAARVVELTGDGQGGEPLRDAELGDEGLHRAHGGEDMVERAFLVLDDDPVAVAPPDDGRSAVLVGEDAALVLARLESDGDAPVDRDEDGGVPWFDDGVLAGHEELAGRLDLDHRAPSVVCSPADPPGSEVMSLAPRPALAGMTPMSGCASRIRVASSSTASARHRIFTFGPASIVA